MLCVMPFGQILLLIILDGVVDCQGKFFGSHSVKESAAVHEIRDSGNSFWSHYMIMDSY